ncbi:MAG: hypothetical protein ACREAO_02440 [Nitrososphaera sp.]|jgi:hypothetical protein
MKVSELCAMIQESIRSGRYPLETDTQKKLAGSIEVANRSEIDDLKAASVAVEVRVQALYSVNNYVPNIQHLPGVIEADVVDSFKMICRRIDRIDRGVQLSRK